MQSFKRTQQAQHGDGGQPLMEFNVHNLQCVLRMHATRKHLRDKRIVGDGYARLHTEERHENRTVERNRFVWSSGVATRECSIRFRYIMNHVGWPRWKGAGLIRDLSEFEPQHG